MQEAAEFRSLHLALIPHGVGLQGSMNSGFLGVAKKEIDYFT